LSFVIRVTILQGHILLPLCCLLDPTTADAATCCLSHVLLYRQVTYFYRWPDLADAIESSSNNTRRLARALTSLGITQHEKDVEVMLKKRGCGRTPPNHFGMRYVSDIQRVACVLYIRVRRCRKACTRAVRQSRVAWSLTSLGITQHEKDVEVMLKKRGCRRTPPNHFGMRYVSDAQGWHVAGTWKYVGASKHARALLERAGKDGPCLWHCTHTWKGLKKVSEVMLNKRGCGRTPPNHFGMRYVSDAQGAF
jgi:hypothetical protein